MEGRGAHAPKASGCPQRATFFFASVLVCASETLTWLNDPTAPNLQKHTHVRHVAHTMSSVFFLKSLKKRTSQSSTSHMFELLEVYDFVMCDSVPEVFVMLLLKVLINTITKYLTIHIVIMILESHRSQFRQDQAVLTAVKGSVVHHNQRTSVAERVFSPCGNATRSGSCSHALQWTSSTCVAA